MMVLFRAVTDHGTGAAVAALQHPLGGKTGTTSDFTDAWFLGFSPSVTCGVWVGFDSRQSLGDKETGARAALPIWITFMHAEIAGKDDEQFLADQHDTPMNQAAEQVPAEPVPLAGLQPQPASLRVVSAAGMKTPPITHPRAIGSTAAPALHP
jgi:penicillin-binding protein 1A